MKKIAFIGLPFILATLLLSSFIGSSALFIKAGSARAGIHFRALHPSAASHKIKIALLLDTSNSMDGLIEQAKSQLWKLVNELSAYKYNNEPPELEIALYEYGNARLNSSEGYIRQVSMFTNELDVISEKLFALKTNGGSEFCGHVIRTSLKELEWNSIDGNLQIIFIAGNEPFTQGNVNYQTSCGMASEKSVYVNTIFCGSYDEGVTTDWKKGATLASGSYMNIDHNQKTFYVQTPYDAPIEALNDKLNSTYVYYGVSGSSKKEMQLQQDKNANYYGSANNTERIVSKSSSFYKNYSWDLVDATSQSEFDITKVKEEHLPTELKGKTAEYKTKYITDKKKERELIKDEIKELNKKRTAFILEKQKSGTVSSNSLDAVMMEAIKIQAAQKGFDKGNSGEGSIIVPALQASKVDFNAFENLAKEVKEYRKDRLVSLETFKKYAKEENTIILDTRSDKMFQAKHVRGAIHLNFSDFTQANLAKIIPSYDTRILIYCNNNFSYRTSITDLINFTIKSYIPPVVMGPTQKELTLALNIPTFINLYGYGYKNVFELADLVSVNDPRIQFEGTAAGASGLTSPLLFAPASKVDFNAFEKLTEEVKEFRKDRLIELATFQQFSKEENVIILDTRSDEMYKAKHIKGAIHLNFSDFTQANLAKVVPSPNTKILIYCNNNFGEDEIYFETKKYVPPVKSEKELTLALNIPTFINLFGYGYKNVYELSELISVFDKRVEFEGTAVAVTGF